MVVDLHTIISSILKCKPRVSFELNSSGIVMLKTVLSLSQGLSTWYFVLICAYWQQFNINSKCLYVNKLLTYRHFEFLLNCWIFVEFGIKIPNVCMLISYKHTDIWNFCWIVVCQHKSTQSIMCRAPVIPLPNNNFFDWSKLKELADNKINVTEKLKFVMGMSRKPWGKRRKCWLPAFSPFPTMFSKGFFPRVVKSRNCVVKGYTP